MEVAVPGARAADIRSVKIATTKWLFGNGPRPDKLGWHDEKCARQLAPAELTDEQLTPE